MDCRELIKQLGYKDNPAFLQDERLVQHPGYSFFFLQAKKMDKGATFHGVYSLINNIDSGIASSTITPLVYLFEAQNEHQASQIHKKVWCQNTVPYVIVTTPKNIRLYSGFEFDNQRSEEERPLKVVSNANEILEKLSAFTSKAIDSGSIWEKQAVSTEKRVDRHLLAKLKKLSEILTSQGYKLSPPDAHTLIGKYIYLKYLRDRGILSDKRLADAGISEEQVYSQAAQKEKLYDLEKYLDGFLNGSVFPLPPKDRLNVKHIQKVAGVFRGDDPQSGQQVLFDLYDFSFVPIETLSVVYQQFLHQEGGGRSKGAYYTPVHLVNFILDELDLKKPLEKGMKVFDPSCGSGAFLVQCYRRLIERVRKKGKLKPTELRSLLENHIFGLDADKEACRVAELSLSLTLLDYIEPKDLSTYPTFRLPGLHNTNIFHCKGGFFDDTPTRLLAISKNGFDWIVGNPPWKNKYDPKRRYDCKALDWINSNKDQYPIGKQQLAEAFAWKISELLGEDGLCGLLMPALSLFTKNSGKFRSKFFSTVETWCVVNFSNLRQYLFEEAVNPAAAFFFSGKKQWDKAEHYITTYAPFAVEQSLQLSKTGKYDKYWSVFVNSSAIHELSEKDVQEGSSLPWKIAMWGSHKDKLLLDKISRQFIPLKNYIIQHKLFKSEGLQLRDPKDTKEKLVRVNEIRGQKLLLMESLRGRKDIHYFPDDCFELLPETKDYYTRVGRKDKPLRICQPPHIFLDASRRFVMFSNEFFVVPARQIGISGYKSQESILKALALYLKSDFVNYQQWLTSAAWGIERDRPNLDDLIRLPIPFRNVSPNELSALAKLHDSIVNAEKGEQLHNNDSFFEPQSSVPGRSSKLLLKEMNNTFYNLLGLSKKQRWQINDLLSVRIKLNEGKIAKEAIKPATRTEIFDFTNIFQEELDLFLDHTGTKKVHKISVFYTERSAVLIVDHLTRSKPTRPEVIEVEDNKSRQEFDNLQSKLTVQKSQWMYFTRCLRIYEERKTYIFKPRQRLYWLKSQALVEADEFLAEKVGVADD